MSSAAEYSTEPAAGEIQPLTHCAEGVARATGAVPCGDGETLGTGLGDAGVVGVGAGVGVGPSPIGVADGVTADGAGVAQTAEGADEGRRSLTGMLSVGIVLRAGDCW